MGQAFSEPVWSQSVRTVGFLGLAFNRSAPFRFGTTLVCLLRFVLVGLGSVVDGWRHWAAIRQTKEPAWKWLSERALRSLKLGVRVGFEPATLRL